MPKVPNTTTIRAIEDVRNGKTAKHKNVEELIAALNKGLNSGVSKRSVTDIIRDKTKARLG